MTHSSCQWFVEQKLKAPGTAEFPGFSDREVRVHHAGGGKYIVKAYVDAQNAFGAKLRASYLCELTDNGDDTWSAGAVITE